MPLRARTVDIHAHHLVVRPRGRANARRACGMRAATQAAAARRQQGAPRRGEAAAARRERLHAAGKAALDSPREGRAREAVRRTAALTWRLATASRRAPKPLAPARVQLPAQRLPAARSDAAMAGEATARATFELENAIAPLDPATEALFRYDAQLQRAIDQQKPWRDNPQFFKQCAPPLRRGARRLLTARRVARARAHTRRRSVRISALALVKMTMHCRSGGNLEARRRGCSRGVANPRRADAPPRCAR